MNFWNKYGAHVAAYLLGVLPIVQAIAPTVIPGWGAAVAVAAGVGIALIHNIQTAIAGGTGAAASPVVTITPVVKNTAAKMLPLVFAVSVAATVVSGLSGCAALTTAINTPSTTQTLIQDGVELGTSSAILATPAAGRQALAANIITAANAVIGVDTDQQMTLSQLETVAAQRIAKTSLNPAVQAIINSAVATVANALAAKVSNGVLTGAETTSINTVMNWIIAGATPYTT